MKALSLGSCWKTAFAHLGPAWVGMGFAYAPINKYRKYKVFISFYLYFRNDGVTCSSHVSGTTFIEIDNAG